jgi:hypothetical protein
MSIQPFFNPENKTDETMNIYVKSVSAESFNIDNLNLNDLEVNSLTSKEYKFKDEDNNTYDNLNISYNTDVNMYYEFIPNTPGQWWSLQSNNFKSILQVPNNNLKVGSRFILLCNLELFDTVNPNTVDFALKLGNTQITNSLFTTNALSNISTYVNLVSHITVFEKNNNPKEYTFIINSNYIETTNNNATTRSLTNNFKLENVSYSGTNSIIEYMYKNNGPTSFNTRILRGNYTLNQIV